MHASFHQVFTLWWWDTQRRAVLPKRQTRKQPMNQGPARPTLMGPFTVEVCRKGGNLVVYEKPCRSLVRARSKALCGPNPVEVY